MSKKTPRLGTVGREVIRQIWRDSLTRPVRGSWSEYESRPEDRQPARRAAGGRGPNPYGRSTAAAPAAAPASAQGSSPWDPMMMDDNYPMWSPSFQQAAADTRERAARPEPYRQPGEPFEKYSL